MSDLCKCGAPATMVFSTATRQVALCDACWRESLRALKSLAKTSSRSKRGAGKRGRP